MNDYNTRMQKYEINEETSEEEVVETTVTSSSTTSQSSSSTPYDINNLPPTNDPYPETNRYFIILNERILNSPFLFEVS